MCSILSPPFPCKTENKSWAPTSLGPHIADCCLQSSAGSFDTLQAASSSIIGTHMEEQQEATVIDLDKLWQHSPRSRSQASRKPLGNRLGWQTVTSSSHCMESPTSITPHFLLSVLHSSGSASPDALLESTSGFSSALKNFFFSPAKACFLLLGIQCATTFLTPELRVLTFQILVS